MKKAFKKLVSQKTKLTAHDAPQTVASQATPDTTAKTAEYATSDVHPAITETGLDLLAKDGLPDVNWEPGYAASYILYACKYRAIYFERLRACFLLCEISMLTVRHLVGHLWTLLSPFLFKLLYTSQLKHTTRGCRHSSHGGGVAVPAGSSGQSLPPMRVLMHTNPDL